MKLHEIAARRRVELIRKRLDKEGKVTGRKDARLLKVEKVFKEVFKDIGLEIKKAGITYEIMPNAYMPDIYDVIFKAGARKGHMQFRANGTWRLRADMDFGQWPVEDLAVYLVDNVL